MYDVCGVIPSVELAVQALMKGDGGRSQTENILIADSECLL